MSDPVITLGMLRARGACAPQRKLFARLAPNGVAAEELPALAEKYAAHECAEDEDGAPWPS